MGGYIMEIIRIDGNSLNLEDFIRITRENVKIELDESAVDKVNKAREFVDKLVKDGKTSYGITTGFGKFNSLKRSLLIAILCILI